MLIKNPNPRREQKYMKWFKGFIAFEFIALFGSYYVWRQLNTSRDFRYYMHNNYPFILNQFYNFTKTANPHCTVDVTDKQIWSMQEKSN